MPDTITISAESRARYAVDPLAETGEHEPVCPHESRVEVSREEDEAWRGVLDTGRNPSDSHPLAMHAAPSVPWWLWPVGIVCVLLLAWPVAFGLIAAADAVMWLVGAR